MSTVFEAAPPIGAKPQRKTTAEIVEDCYVQTAEALSVTQMATDAEIFKALGRARESQEKGVPVCLLETIARVAGHSEEHLGPAIATYSDAIATTLNPIPPTIPFASKLIAPSAFYESFEAIHELARSLLAPVLYAEDTDAIGTGSINPIASIALGDEVHYAVGKRFGIHPFLSCIRMDYEAWAFLCRKHFEL